MIIWIYLLKEIFILKEAFSGKGNIRYKKRYKYNGNLNVNYSNIINSEIGFPDYNTKKDFFINWSHKQDPKSNPTFSFSANVNAGQVLFIKIIHLPLQTIIYQIHLDLA